MSEKTNKKGAMLTMDEQIKQLRNENKWTMDEVATKTGISKSALQRYEKKPEMDVPYQSVMELAKLYDVSLDYMCGLTLNRKHREFPIDELSLTDESIEFLKRNKNFKLINELLSHKDVEDLLIAIEVFVSGKMTAGANDMNAVFSLAENAIRSKVDLNPQDETIAILQQAKIDHNEYLRFRITERFNTLLNSIYNDRKRKNEELSLGISELMKKNLAEFTNNKTIKEKGAFDYLITTLGMPVDRISEEKLKVFEEVIKQCSMYKFMDEKSAIPLSRAQNRKLQFTKNKKK
ncbi:MAG: helix-turn-helix transcriptional regulator [Clostridia bacterium]